MMFPSISVATIVALPVAHALLQPDGVGKLPALGRNSWNAYACDIDETKVLVAANEIINLGLSDAGYEYVNIDDCWAVKSGRDETTGQIIPDPEKFPSSISGVADAIHALGLKIGLYGSAGTETCAGYPAQIGHEELDAASLAAWGIDYWKYDNCFVPDNWNDPYDACVGHNLPADAQNGSCSIAPDRTAPEGYDWSSSNTTRRYNIMRDALLAQNRTILYSLCEWGRADVTSWGNGTGNSWRMSADVKPSWDSIVAILNENSFLLSAVNFWGHNDVDILEVGNGNLTEAESRSHFAFWAVMKSPLIIGTDLSMLSPENLAILKNKYLLAFSQDEVYGEPATPYKWGTNPDWTFNATNPAEYWSGSSTDGTLVLAFNSLNETSEREIKWSEIPQLGGSGCFKATDIWTGESLGCVSGGIKGDVEAHDTIAFLVGEPCT